MSGFATSQKRLPPKRTSASMILSFAANTISEKHLLGDKHLETPSKVVNVHYPHDDLMEFKYWLSLLMSMIVNKL